ncbi:hypothetical protein ABFX02_04G169700 [Erythranthe guttata]
MAIKIIEHCHVAPSPDTALEQSLQLLHFDMIWFPFHLMQNLFFYSFRCSESHFSDTVVPSLKKSLSLTLKHFPPLAGKIIFPLFTGMPVSRYVEGDSVSLTFAASDADLIPLTGNLSRDSDRFHDFVPELPPADYTDTIDFYVAAIQVTLFPDQGICIGFTNHHAIGDGLSMIAFLQTWAMITKLNGDDTHLLTFGQKYLPFYDRSAVPHGDKLATEHWNNVKTYMPTVSLTTELPTNKVRATFVLNEAETLKLKKRGPPNVSSFVIVCAYLWTCMAKLANDEVVDDEAEYLACDAHSHGRLNTPLPETYFGNRFELVVAESTHGRLKGNEGIVFAAEAIEKAIQKTFGGDKKSPDELDILGLMEKRVLGVGGSPTFDMYGADFGWGRPEKYEAVHIDCDGSVSMCKSREFEGGVEIGLSMSKVEMDAFEVIYRQGLNE